MDLTEPEKESLRRLLPRLCMRESRCLGKRLLEDDNEEDITAGAVNKITTFLATVSSADVEQLEEESSYIRRQKCNYMPYLELI